VSLADNTNAMMAYCVTKMVTACSPMDGHFFDAVIGASGDEEWL